MISGIQLVGVVLSLGIVYLTYLYYRRKEFSAQDLLIWIGVAAVFLFASLFPRVLDVFLTPLTVYRVFDLLTIGGFAVLFAIVFRVYRIVRKNEKNLDRLVRGMALEEKKGKKQV